MIDLELRLCEEKHEDARRMRESKSVAKLMDWKFQRGQRFWSWSAGKMGVLVGEWDA